MTPSLRSSEDVLSYWIGDTAETPDNLEAYNKLWFGKSEQTDTYLRKTFSPVLDQLASGSLVSSWAARGARHRLAAIIVLDQFSRNIFRDEARAYGQDALARNLCQTGLLRGEDTQLSETERLFFYLPLEHSESPEDQEKSIEVFTRLLHTARAAYRGLVESTLEYAHAHKSVIDRFGRFPHRNEALGRTSTPEETKWLANGGGF